MIGTIPHRRAKGTGAQPARVAYGLRSGFVIDGTDPLTLDWAAAVTIATAAAIPTCMALREQDDVIHDPQQAADKRFACYLTAEFSTPRWEVWVTYSADGLTWGTPVQCLLSTGGALRGQDPSIVQTFGANPSVHRDGDGLMWMYLENHPDPINHSTHAYSSPDGITWTLRQLDVIANGAEGAWDALIGSPNARYVAGQYVAGQYVVGYEGFGGATESWGVAVGSSPTALTKSPQNPLITGAAHGVGESVFMDAWWLAADGSRVILTGHSGIDDGTQMPRFHTDNTDPLTWVPADFALINDTDPAVRNDLTAHLWRDWLVTGPADDSRIVAVPLT